MCDLEAKFVATFLQMVEVEESNHQENKLEKFGKNNKMLLLGACEGGGKSFKVFF
jgi:hypothetical protein